MFPGASEIFAAMTESFKDSRRRHEEETKRKRIEALSRLLERHPDFPVIAEQLRKLLDECVAWHHWSVFVCRRVYVLW